MSKGRSCFDFAQEATLSTNGAGHPERSRAKSKGSYAQFPHLRKDSYSWLLFDNLDGELRASLRG
jgi:hypothetical protein